MLHVHDVLPPGYDIGVAWPVVDLHEAAQKALDQVLVQVKQRYAKCDGVVEIGYPSNVIVKTAQQRGSDLIVTGTHGRRGVPRMLLGSVAEKVVRTAAVPVVTIPAR